MEHTQRLRLHYVAAMAPQEVFQQQLNIHLFISGRMRVRRGTQARSIWIKPWLNPERRRQFGIHDQLMVELSRDDTRAFKKFLCMPVVEIYGEIFKRVRHRIVKQYTWYREPLNQGLKLVATLRHLVSGAKVSDMHIAIRKPCRTANSTP